MNERSASLIRAARGPLILITVGVLFAFDRFTEFRFGETWPVLLIVAGLLRLFGGSRRDFRGDLRNDPWRGRRRDGGQPYQAYQGYPPQGSAPQAYPPPPPPPAYQPGYQAAPPPPPPPPPYDPEAGRS